MSARAEISVVIAAWNAENTVRRAVESALSQTGVAVEVIVVDDASTDGTADAVRALDHDRVRLISSPANQGPGGARNAGFAAAEADWIAVLDADDAFLEGRLSRLLSAAAGGADVVVDDLLVAGGSGPQLAMYGRRLSRLRSLTLNDLVSSDRMFGAEPGFGYLKPMFRREFLRAHGLRYDPTLRIGEDFALLRDCLAAGALVATEPTAGYLYSRDVGSTSARIDASQVGAIRRSDTAFMERELLDRTVASAFARRESGLRDAEAFLVSVEALKSGRAWTAGKVLLRRPRAAMLYRMPIATRLARLGVRSAGRRASALRDAEC